MTSDGVAHAPRAANRGGDLPRLTSLRAFAAFVVFMFHVRKNTEWAIADGFFMHGYVGVGFFFILSGFVLTWSTRPDTTPTDFFLKRFARVYPSHFVMLLVALALPLLAAPVTALGVAANVTLTQAWFFDWNVVFGLNAVSWSLSCEFFFYAFTPFLLRALHKWNTRRIVWVLGGWFVAMSAVAISMGLAGNRADVYAYTNPLVRSGEFVLGVMLAKLALHGRMPTIPMRAALAAVAVAWAGTYNRFLPQSVSDVLFALPFALVVIAAANADSRDAPGILRHRSLIYAGQVSFAFYLVHELVLINGNLIWGMGPVTLPLRALLLTAVTGACFMFAMALHEWVEKPAQQAIRGWRRRGRGTGALNS